MPSALSLLFDGKFSAYFDEARRDASVWLFVHVPKTAGSSLGSELASLIPPYYNIHIDPLDRSAPGPERFDKAVDEFLRQAERRPFRFVAGHILNRHTQRITDAIPGVRPVTMLRHPLARIVSDFRYQRSPMHPLREEVIRRVPNLEASVALPGQRNRTARHLVPAQFLREENVQASIDYIMNHYAFVGLQESYPTSFRALTALVAEQRSPTEKKRVNDKVEEVSLTPEIVPHIEERNTLDFAIYDFFAGRFRAIEHDLATWLAETDLPPERRGGEQEPASAIHAGG